MTVLGTPDTTDEKYECFVNTFIKCFDESFPLVQISRKRAKDKKWITPELKNSIRQKERLYKKMLNSPTLHNTEQYKNYNRTLSNNLKKAETEYYTYMLQSFGLISDILNYDK